MSAIVVFIAAVIVIAYVLSRPTYEELTKCEDYSEMNTVTTLLTDNGYTYQIDNMTVNVKKQDLTNAKMLIASNDIKPSGYSLDDALNSSLTTTEADKNKKYAKTEIIKTQSENLDIYDNRIEGMKNIVDALENDITKYSSEIEARLEELNLSYNEKTNIILKDLDNRANSLNKKLDGVVMAIDNLLDEKSDDIANEYDILKMKIEDIQKDIDKYMNTIKIFDKAEESAKTIKEDVSKLDVLVKDTKVAVSDMNKTMSEFEGLKQMHKEILEYSKGIKKERESLKDTQDKVNILIEMTDDIQNKFLNIAESNSMIENTEEGIKAVIDIASQIEDKLSFIKDKEEYAENILSQMNKADIEIETVLEKVDGIKSAMVDVEEKRKVFMDKISSLEKDFNKIEKNDKKVQLFLNKLEELNIILEEMQNQRENLNYMKKENDNIVKNLERAEYFVRYLQDLLDNAEKYMSDGKTTSKRSKSNIVDNKKEEFIIKMYKQGWKTDEIVKNSSYSRDEVETIIKKWKDKQSRG